MYKYNRSVGNLPQVNRRAGESEYHETDNEKDVPLPPHPAITTPQILILKFVHDWNINRLTVFRNLVRFPLKVAADKNRHFSDVLFAQLTAKGRHREFSVENLIVELRFSLVRGRTVAKRRDHSAVHLAAVRFVAVTYRAILTKNRRFD